MAGLSSKELLIWHCSRAICELGKIGGGRASWRLDFCVLPCQLSGNIYFLGVISGNINPPGAVRGQIPALETQISAKSQGLKTGWSAFFEVFKVCGEKFQSCGINFSMRFQIK